jgi:hypothetical protein
MYTVNDGGECVIGGSVDMHVMQTTVNPGGKFVFNPSRFTFASDVASGNVKSYLCNKGTLEIPNGFTLGGASKGGCTFTVEQLGGEMLLGGGIVMADTVDHLDFRLSNGTVRVVNDAAFTGCRTVAMLSGAEAVIDVVDGSTADFSAMTFEADTAVVKTGQGTLRLGASVPASLTVESGRLVVGAAAVFGEGLSLKTGAGLHFAAAGSSAVSIAGLATAEVTVDAALLKRGTVILQSADETLLSALAEKLSPLVEADKEAGLVLAVRPAVDGSGDFRLCVAAKPGLSVILR